MDTVFVTQIGDRSVFQKVKTQNSDSFPET